MIELKPDRSDTPESGFEHPEEKIQEAALEMYDGFIEYINSFIKTQVDEKIITACRKNSKKCVKT